MTDQQIFEVGGVQIRVSKRTFADDGGPTVCVFAEVDGEPVQMLRFDCFRKDPHFHYDPSGKDDKRNLDRHTVPDPVAWTVEQLRHHLTEMVDTAGFHNVARLIDPSAVAGVLCKVESIMRKWEGQQG